MKTPRKNDQQKSDEWISRILTSTEGAERATPPPFLLTRIEAELDSAHAKRNVFARRPRQIVAYGVSFAVLALLNIVAVEYFTGTVAEQREHQTASRTGNYRTTSGATAYSELTGSSFHLYE